MMITLFTTLAEAEARVAIDRLFTVKLPRPPFKVCLVRRGDNTWRAFEDNCPHKKAPFSKGGYLNPAGDVVCPLHQYAFELDTGTETTHNGCRSMAVLQLEASAEHGLRLKL
jgi:3-phenylpropionate/trans-cinnamate dioxygenase ferredoxin subunit